MLEMFTKNPFRKIFRPFAKREDLYRIMVEKKFDRTIYTPQIKRGDSRFNQLESIVKIYGKYYILELNEPSGLSEEECRDHIKEYVVQRNLERNLNKIEVHYIPVEV